MSIWKQIPGFDYEASTDGEIRNNKTKKVIHPYTDPLQTYGRISIYKDGRATKVMAHYLVALAFLGPKPEGTEIDHINSDRYDNRPGNLRYVSPEVNRANPMTILKRRIRHQRLMLPAPREYGD